MMNIPPKMRIFIPLGIGIIIVVLAFVIPDWIASQAVAPSPSGPAPAPARVRYVTMDGTDPASGTTIDPINLWDDYQTRSRVTGHAVHGALVTLLQRSGDGCEVQTNTGDRGWVTCSNFIKEFR